MQSEQETDRGADGPLTQQFNLVEFTKGLIQDLEGLRAGKVSVRDANARAALAKQILRSVHYVVTAQKFIEQHAIPLKPDTKND